MARTERPTLQGQIKYVLSRPKGAVKTWAAILWRHHLMEVSGFAKRDNTESKPAAQRILHTVSRFLNKLFVVLLIPGTLGLAIFLSQSPIRVWPAALLGPSVIATAPLVYFQGDRVVFIALLLMLPFAGLGISKLLSLNGSICR